MHRPPLVPLALLFLSSLHTGGARSSRAQEPRAHSAAVARLDTLRVVVDRSRLPMGWLPRSFAEVYGGISLEGF
jgi:hypothetical protein